MRAGYRVYAGGVGLFPPDTKLSAASGIVTPVQVRYIRSRGPTDRLAVRRSDGSACLGLGRAPALFHDLAHFAVEQALGLSGGVWGHVDRGAEIGFGAALNPARCVFDAVALAQAESVVECFLAELWGGGAEEALLAPILATTCQMRAVPAPDLDQQSRRRAREALAEMRSRVAALAPGEALALYW